MSDATDAYEANLKAGQPSDYRNDGAQPGGLTAAEVATSNATDVTRRDTTNKADKVDETATGGTVTYAP